MHNPRRDRDERSVVDAVAHDQPCLVQLLQQLIAVKVIEREHLSANALRSILQPTLTICDRPQPSEQQARLERQCTEFGVREEPRLEESRTGH
jgi:hypothetical protein